MMCQVIWVFILSTTLVLLGFIASQKGIIGCGPNGTAWRFKNQRFAIGFHALFTLVAYSCFAVLRVAFIKTTKPNPSAKEVKRFLFGDLGAHFSRGEKFESDDSDHGEPAELQTQLETGQADTDRPLKTQEDRPASYFDFKALPKPLHDKGISEIPKNNKYENLKTASG
jgi:hypothetical protein